MDWAPLFRLSLGSIHIPLHKTVMKHLALILTIMGSALAYPEHSTLTRVPSYPLAVRNPYTNFWLPGNTLPGTWPAFWTGGWFWEDGAIKGWSGMIKVDNVDYVWMGSPNIDNRRLATQTFAAVTPTQTIFGLEAGPVSLNVTFFSPVEHSDIRLQSIPLSYVFVDVVSNDMASHSVQLYMDISGEWASSDTSKEIKWEHHETPQGLKTWTTELQTPNMFREFNEYPEWGRAVLSTGNIATHASGSDREIRSAFLSTGRLPNTNDADFRCISCDWPVFAFSHDLSSISTQPARVSYVIGLVRDINANFLGQQQWALWRSYWPNLDEMLDFFFGDFSNALITADGLDEKLLGEAFAAGGQGYADIITMSLRQSYAGNEFSGTAENPLYYQKEISSGAFMQTVDVIYPAAPMFYYLNVTYLKLLLDPLFHFMEQGEWTRPFAMHDIGDFFPNALGQGYGADMPVEESGNMIMMVGDIIFHPDADRTESIAYARSHFEIMSVWANYLLDNCLYPVDQLTTDDFMGPTQLNSGLALKGILAMATFAKISEFIGETGNATFYKAKVDEYVPIWLNESMHGDGDHLKMEYNVTDGYQFKYNAFHDRLLNLGVVPQAVYDMEADYYLTKLEPYGIPFVHKHDYTKSDWELWTAAAFGDSNPELKASLIDALARFLRYTAQRVPFTDWYVTATANKAGGFQSRPVAGGHFAILAMDVAKGKIHAGGRA